MHSNKNKRPVTPPAWAQRFFEWYCDSTLLEDLEGDLHERFYTRLEKRPSIVAKLLFVWDVVRFFRPYIIKKRGWHYSFVFPLRHYITSSVRRLLRHRLNTTLNLTGLTCGLSCFIFIMLYVVDEFQYDRHYIHAERIYRITTSIIHDGRHEDIAYADAHLSTQLTESIPEVEHAVGIVPVDGKVTVEVGDHYFTERNLFHAGPQYFLIFNHDWIEGDASTALAEPGSVVLTEKLAQKYFGRKEALYSTIRMGARDFIVTGVIKNLPAQTDLKFDALLAIESETIADITDWCYQYALLQPGSSLSEFQHKLRNLYRENKEQELLDYNATGNYHAESLTELHFSEPKLFDTPKSKRETIYIFICVALLILGVASINYINLSFAQVMHTQSQAGIRKVLGASSGQVRMHYLFESLLLSLVACVCAFMLVMILLEPFNRITQKEFSINHLLEGRYMLTALGIASLTGLLAGSYPANFLSRTSPLRAIKVTHASLSRMVLRNGLIILQFTTSITLLICAKIIYDQTELLRDGNPGFDKNHIVVVDIPKDRTIFRELFSFKDELKEFTFIQSASLVGYNSLPGQDADMDAFARDNAQYKDDIQLVANVSVDEDYFDVLNIPLITGRVFTSNDLSDGRVIVINQAFADKLQWQNPVGNTLTLLDDQEEYEIIGVIKDFHFKSLRQRAEPMIFFADPSFPEKLMIRMNADHRASSFKSIEAVWKKHFTYPFDFDFLDHSLAAHYQQEEIMRSVVIYFTSITLAIALLGLFGLVAIVSMLKQKEFSIRKIFGATLWNISSLLLKDFLILILIASATACFVGWYIMTKWLEEFAVRVQIDISMLVVTCGLSCLLAVIVMSCHAIQVYLRDPLNTLRYE